MRATYLQFRNPDEKTAEFYEAAVTHTGQTMEYVNYKHKSHKGTISKQIRFEKPETQNVGFNLVGPGSYNADTSYKALNKPSCTSVFARLPQNLYQFQNAHEFTYVGDQVKQIPCLKNCHHGGKAKSLKKVVNETNEIGDSITVNDIVIQKNGGMSKQASVSVANKGILAMSGQRDQRYASNQKLNAMKNSMMSETRDTRDTLQNNDGQTFAGQSFQESDGGKRLPPAAFQNINTDSTIETQKIDIIKGETPHTQQNPMQNPNGEESPNGKYLLPQVTEAQSKPRTIQSSNFASRKQMNNVKVSNSENKTIRTSQGAGTYYTENNNSSNTRPQTTSNSDARYSLISGAKRSMPAMNQSYASNINNFKKFNLIGQGTKSHLVVEQRNLSGNKLSNIKTYNNIYGGGMMKGNAGQAYNTINTDSRPQTQQNHYSDAQNSTGRIMAQSMQEKGMRNGQSQSTLTTNSQNIYKNFENYENLRRNNLQQANLKMMANKQYPVLRKNRYSFLRKHGIYEKNLQQQRIFGGEGYQLLDMKQVSGKKINHERNLSNSQIDNYMQEKVENDSENQEYPRSITPSIQKYHSSGNLQLNSKQQHQSEAMREMKGKEPKASTFYGCYQKGAAPKMKNNQQPSLNKQFQLYYRNKTYEGN